MTDEQTPAAGPSLLLCPFCGGEASIERYGNTRVSTIYSCDDCGCQLETGEEFHGRAWNTRRPHFASPVDSDKPSEGNEDRATVVSTASPASSSSVVQGDAGGVVDYGDEIIDCDLAREVFESALTPTAAPVSRPAGEGEREAVARIIDDAPDHQTADELADAILSLLRPAAPDALVEALGKAVVFNAASAVDPLAIRLEFVSDEDRVNAANAIDAALQPGGER